MDILDPERPSIVPRPRPERPYMPPPERCACRINAAGRIHYCDRHASRGVFLAPPDHEPRRYLGATAAEWLQALALTVLFGPVLYVVLVIVILAGQTP